MEKAEAAKGDISKHNIKKTDDDVGKEMTKTTIENLYKEKLTFETLIDEATKGLDNYEKQWAVDKRIWELRIEAPKQIEPTYEYHNHPEFWDLLKQKMVFGFRQEKALAEGHMNKFKYQIKANQEQLENAIKKLKEMGEDV